MLLRDNIYVDGISARALFLKAKSQQNGAQEPASPPSQPPSETSSPTSPTQPQNTRAPPRGKLYIDGQDVSAGPSTTPQRQTALSLLVESGDAKEINTPSNWLQVAKPNQRNTTSQPNVTVDPDTVTAGTFDAYHPSTGEKVKRWFEQNVDKIPIVNFFHLIHEQAQTAKKETMIELAEKGKTKEALAVGVLYGTLIDAFIDAPGTIYETAKSIWDSAPSNNMGPLGLRHETKSEKIITGNPDEEIKNELIMARAAPETYRAEQKLKQAQKLQPEIIKLNEQAEQLKEQAKWFKENRQRAENDPFFARIYNAEAQEFNQQVIEYNQRVLSVEAQLKALGVDEANKQVEEFNSRLNGVQRNFAIGEIAGSLVASAVLAEAIAPTVRAVAPEKVVRTEASFSDVFGDTAGTRTTVKETVYKGWLRKKPVETKYSTVLEADGDIRYVKSFINGPEGVTLRVGGKDTRQFVLNKFMSTEPLKAEPGQTPSASVGPTEFEKITGKPWPTGVAKKELETQTILRTTDGQEIAILDDNLVIGKTTFRRGQQLKPEFSISAKENVLTPEDISLMQKITNSKAVRVGDKYLKVTRSGNVFSTFYDPPVSELLEQGELRIVPDTGTFRMNSFVADANDKGIAFAVVGIEHEFSKPSILQIETPEKLSIYTPLVEKHVQVPDVKQNNDDRIQLRRGDDLDIQVQVPDLTKKSLVDVNRDTTPSIKFYPGKVQTQPLLELSTQTPISTTPITTLDFPKPDKPKVFVPGYIRPPAGGSLFGTRKAFGRDSWIRKLAFFKNPFGGSGKSSLFSLNKKRKSTKRRGRRKARKGRGKGRGGGKRAKKR